MRKSAIKSYIVGVSCTLTCLYWIILDSRQRMRLQEQLLQNLLIFNHFINTDGPEDFIGSFYPNYNYMIKLHIIWKTFGSHAIFSYLQKQIHLSKLRTYSKRHYLVLGWAYPEQCWTGTYWAGGFRGCSVPAWRKSSRWREMNKFGPAIIVEEESGR